jgi:hypothetical protein
MFAGISTIARVAIAIPGRAVFTMTPYGATRAGA